MSRSSLEDVGVAETVGGSELRVVAAAGDGGFATGGGRRREDEEKSGGPSGAQAADVRV